MVAVVARSLGGGSGSSGYVVRAIFDNGGFMVTGEEVRVAGANVGEIESVDVDDAGRGRTASEDGGPRRSPARR